MFYSHFPKKSKICYKKGLRGLIVGHRRSCTSCAMVRLVGGLMETLVCWTRIQSHFGRVALYNLWRGLLVLRSTLFDN